MIPAYDPAAASAAGAVSPDSLDAASIIALRAWSEFYEKRLALLRDMLGPRMHDAGTLECLHLIGIGLADRMPARPSDCIARCAALGLGSPNTVRSILAFLQNAGLVVPIPCAGKRREVCFLPTGRAIAYYGQHLQLVLESSAAALDRLRAHGLNQATVISALNH